jgi:integrase
MQWLTVELKTRTRRKPRRSDAVLLEDIERALESTQAMVRAGDPLRLRGLRDQALILLGWTCALRRSELVAVRRNQIRKTRSGGYELVIPIAKTSDGDDQIVPVVRARRAALDAITAVEAWVAAARIRGDEPLFRRVLRDGSMSDDPLHPTAVRDILQAHGLPAGVSPHGLRSGFVTQARLNGAANHQIRVVTRHKSNAMLDIYTRQVDPDRQGPGSLDA